LDEIPKPRKNEYFYLITYEMELAPHARISFIITGIRDVRFGLAIGLLASSIVAFLVILKDLVEELYYTKID